MNSMIDYTGDSYDTGDELTDLISLVETAYDIVEIWKAEGLYNQNLKKAWLKRARELGANPSL